MAKRIKWSIIGVPDHQGVVNVGGRIGAALGPEHLLQSLRRMKGPSNIWKLLKSEIVVSDLGSQIEHNLEAAAQAIAAHHPLDGVSCVLGGGHDHGFSHLLGISRALGPKTRIGCINIDAHFDLRSAEPIVTSGSPFRIAIERGVIRGADLVEFGIQSHCNAKELWDFAHENQIEVIEFKDLRHNQAIDSFKQSLKKLGSKVDTIVVSLDLDAAAECHAPGVSAPQAEGFSSSELVEMMEIAGRDEKVSSLGIFELNPLHDVGERTARLGATCVHHFVETALRNS